MAADPDDQQILDAIDQAFDAEDFSAYSDRDLLEHIARCLTVISMALGKMGDALPATLSNPVYAAALKLIIPKKRR